MKGESGERSWTSVFTTSCSETEAQSEQMSLLIRDRRLNTCLRADVDPMSQGNVDSTVRLVHCAKLCVQTVFALPLELILLPRSKDLPAVALCEAVKRQWENFSRMMALKKTVLETYSLWRPPLMTA